MRKAHADMNGHPCKTPFLGAIVALLARCARFARGPGSVAKSRPQKFLAGISLSVVALLTGLAVVAEDQPKIEDERYYEERVANIERELATLKASDHTAENLAKARRLEAELQKAQVELGQWIMAHGSWSGCSFQGGMGRVRIGAKWGYLSKSGEIAIEPRFENAYDFYGELATAKMGGKWGCIDKSGKIIIPCDYDFLFPFLGDYTAFAKAGKWGYLGRDGKVLIEAKFDRAFSFSKTAKLAAVMLNKKWGYIDRAGKIAIAPRLEQASAFIDGRACVQEDKKFGYLREDGNWAIKPNFAWANDFNEGLACVANVGDDGSMIYTFIDLDGKIAFPTRPGFPSSFSEGLAPLIAENGLFGYMDKKGEIKIAPQFESAWEFSDGLAAIMIRGKWSFVDKSGEPALDEWFDDVTSFSGGFAAVKKDGRWGYINKDGKYIWRQPEPAK